MKDVLIANQDELNRKISKIKRDGVSHLHIVSDFDRTLTSTFMNGKKQSTGIAQIRAGGYLGDNYTKKAFALYDKYRPMEANENISSSERAKYMHQWWSEHIKLISESKLTKAMIETIVKDDKMKSRDGSLEFYDVIAKSDIPLLIFSAGVGDIIEEFLKNKGKLTGNMHIISNFFDYDNMGFVCGYKSDIIHTFNKNEGHLKKSPYLNQIKNRKNVILIGDALADISMIEGLEHETVIKIGFLNENADKLKENYLEAYDVVILNDGTFEYVNELLKKIIQ